MTQLRPFSAAIGLLLVSAITPPASPAQLVRAYVANDSVTVGDRLTLVVVAEHAREDTVAFPDFRPEPGLPGARFGDLIVFGARNEGRYFQGADREYLVADTITYEVATFAIDSAFVPQVAATITGPSGVRRVASQPFFLPVVSLVPPDADSMQDITPLASFGRRWWPLLLGLMLLAGLWFAYRWWRNRPVSEGVESEVPAMREPVERPIDELLRRLKALESANLETVESVRSYFVELADAIRTYLERRLQIPALEQTTTELFHDLKTLRSIDVPDEVPGEVLRILEQADLAKFARQRHSEDVSRRLLVQSRTLALDIENSLRAAAERERRAAAEKARAEAAIAGDGGSGPREPVETADTSRDER